MFVETIVSQERAAIPPLPKNTNAGFEFAALLRGIEAGMVVAPLPGPQPAVPEWAAPRASGLGLAQPGILPSSSLPRTTSPPVSGAPAPIKVAPSNAFLQMIQERASAMAQTIAAWDHPGLSQTPASLAPIAPPMPISRPLPFPTMPSITPAGVPALPASNPSLNTRSILAGLQDMSFPSYPRPANDNGRGIDWVPTLYSTPAVVDRYVKQATAMHVKWATFLNDGTKIGDNDYLVKQLVSHGIEPVMRIYTPPGQAITGSISAMVHHYTALGVHYFQPYNEPNLTAETNGAPPTPDHYLDQWIPAARAIAKAGGLPAFGSLSPGGNYDDVTFFQEALQGLKKRGALDTLDHAWVSLHNYTLNHPLNYTKDSNGFLKFRTYNQILQHEIGRSLPIISTEGGTFVGENEDKTMPAIDQQKQIQMVTGAFQYMEKPHEPYYFASCYWTIANQDGGGHNLGFEHQALFSNGTASPIVAALKKMP